MGGRFGSAILGLAAVVCVWDSMTAPRGMESDAILALVMAFFLLLRAFTAAARSVPTVVGGCVVTLIAVGVDRGLLNERSLIWVVIMIMGFVFFIFGERIENWLR